jgi:error-prone DNA polymerase
VTPLDFILESNSDELPPLSAIEALAFEQQVLGLSSGEHVLSFYRAQLARQGILGSIQLMKQQAGRQVRVAGLVVVHQAPPTAKGFHFITLEDESGLIDVIIRPHIYERYRHIWRRSWLLLVSGQVQREGEVVNVLATGGQG